MTGGEVPPPYIGPRSIESGAGLGTTYDDLIAQAITTTATGEKIYCGPADDPFFVDLGGVFDLGNMPRQNGPARDGLGQFNVHTIAIQIPISLLLKDGAPAVPTSILDPGESPEIRGVTRSVIYYFGCWSMVNVVT